MELWFNVSSFGTEPDDWRRQPRLILKPGDSDEAAYYLSNYFLSIFGTNRDFSGGYWSDEAETWVDIRSRNDLLRVGEWYI